MKKKGDVAKVSINDELTIYSATAHKESLLKYLSDCDEMEVDLSGVGEMDSAGLQLLLMLKQEAEHEKKALRLNNHSEPVLEILELVNLVSYFGDPVVIPAEWKK